MNVRLMFASAVLIGLAANAANATMYFDTVYFDSTTLPNTKYSNDGWPDTYAAGSFTASSPDFTQVSLLLSAGTPTDGSSTLVYLVADDGSGGATGHSGNPDAIGGVPGTSELLATISASSLSSTPSLVTLNLSGTEASAITTQNDEYWVELVFQTNSSILWYSTSTDLTNGIGLTNQGTVDSIYSPTNEPDTVGGAYDMIVDTPEPTTLAIFGGALAGLGYVRRRSAKAV